MARRRVEPVASYDDIVDILYSRIANMGMELKPQDVLVLLKVAIDPAATWTYAALAKSLKMSPSEVHACVERSVVSGLAVKRARGVWSPVASALLEFCEHGVKYAFPAIAGPVRRGVPTTFGVAPLADQINSAAAEVPVWAHASGTHRGPSLSPLYRTAPHAALEDPALHSALALIDALRIGRSRERSLAASLLKDQLSPRRAA